ncbi:LysR family transcriptional regulator [Paraburkholderia bannensis]|uniref:LysR family transcriptional regulator n=1 Tax=Paraburkholderia bannensis TaxID=765414 RepID=UPI002AB78A06|nr:LysR family transcriptional regulator [Paraburkholderia bannensis]
MDKFAELTAFVAVAEAGDFTAAARRLDLTPSGVSKSMTRLEERLGCTLLRRSFKGIALTDEGSGFLEAARRALSALHEAESSATPKPSGTLRVSCLPSFAIYQLAPLMPEFQREYPSIRLEFILSSETRTLLDRQADVAIVSGALPDSALVARRFATSRWLACASPDYLLRNGCPEELADLRHHKTLNFIQRTPWNNWLDEADEVDDKYSREFVSYGANHGDMLLALARAGAGVVRLAEYHLSADLRTGSVREILQGKLAEEDEVLYLVYERHKHVSRRVSAFLEFIERRIIEGREPWRLATV